MNGKSDSTYNAQMFLLSGEYDRVLALEALRDQRQPWELPSLRAWALVMQGVFLKSRAADEIDADSVRREAEAKFKSALGVWPLIAAAYVFWGELLLEWASDRTGPTSDELYDQAMEKFERALLLRRDFFEALDYWGRALVFKADIANGSAEIRTLLSSAIEKFKAALAIKPDEADIAHRSALSMMQLAAHTPMPEADLLLLDASETMARIAAAHPDDCGILTNWGTMLYQRALLHSDESAADLYVEATEKFESALTFEPGLEEPLHNWLLALRGWEGLSRGIHDVRLLGSRARFAIALKNAQCS